MGVADLLGYGTSNTFENAAAGAPSMNSTDTAEEAPPAGATPPAPGR